MGGKEEALTKERLDLEATAAVTPERAEAEALMLARRWILCTHEKRCECARRQRLLAKDFLAQQRAGEREGMRRASALVHHRAELVTAHSEDGVALLLGVAEAIDREAERLGRG